MNKKMPSFLKLARRGCAAFSTNIHSPKHIFTMSCFKKNDISTILSTAAEMKENPAKFSEAMKNETLLMLFAKPSLRTRVSFETGMTQMGGHAIYYPLDSKATISGKETISDFSKVVSRYANILMARVSSRVMVRELAEHATIPVINGLDDWGHPTQILADFQTILEHSNQTSLAGMKLCFVGDVHNNVTYDLMRGCAIMGMHVAVCGPLSAGDGYKVDPAVIAHAKELASFSGGSVLVTEDVDSALEGADVVYADSIMSYGITKELEEERRRIFFPYMVTRELMEKAKPEALFMHCLPAERGADVSAEVIDGPRSVVFDEAENRLHAHKALMLFCQGKLD